jgi:tRNA threonylcarbamoyladenosine biosynthesis protein TsaE
LFKLILIILFILFESAMNKEILKENYICRTPENTFDLGEKIGQSLKGGEIILLSGGLGAGKTLFTKGLMHGLEYDVDEVTSPSFALVNLYKAESFEVYHIDLWRIDENSDAAFAVGLDEILDDKNAVVIIEWSERLRNFSFPENTFAVKIEGDGDDARKISIEPKWQV